MRRQQQGVPPEPCRQSGHRRGIAAERSGELPVGRAGVEAGGHGDGEIAALEVVSHGERLQGEGPAAAQAKEARHDSTVALPDVGPVTVEPERFADPIREAVPPGTVLGDELIGR